MILTHKLIVISNCFSHTNYFNSFLLLISPFCSCFLLQKALSLFIFLRKSPLFPKAQLRSDSLIPHLWTWKCATRIDAKIPKFSIRFRDESLNWFIYTRIRGSWKIAPTSAILNLALYGIKYVVADVIPEIMIWFLLLNSDAILCYFLPCNSFYPFNLCMTYFFGYMPLSYK